MFTDSLNWGQACKIARRIGVWLARMQDELGKFCEPDSIPFPQFFLQSCMPDPNSSCILASQTPIQAIREHVHHSRRLTLNFY